MTRRANEATALTAVRDRAALAGGPFGGWGCALGFSLALLATPLPAQTLALPSGLSVDFFDVRREVVGSAVIYRFRYVAPDIGMMGTEFHDIVSEIEWLCSTHALPVVARSGPQAGQIIVTLMEKPVEFGAISPDVIQFFEAYSVQNDRCIWEAF